MVQAFERPQEIILLELPEVRVEKIKPKVIEEAKARLSKVKNYAKKHKYYMCIKDVKAKLDAKLYSMRMIVPNF